MANPGTDGDDYVAQDDATDPAGPNDTIDWDATSPGHVQPHGVMPNPVPVSPGPARVVHSSNPHRLIGAVTVAAVLLAMIGVPFACWNHHRTRATDQEWRPRLVGTWVMRRDNGDRQARVALARDGGFVYEDLNDETSFAGTWELKGGDIRFIIMPSPGGKPARSRKMVWRIKEFYSVEMIVQPDSGKPQMWRKQ